jgi:hypothetical protein
MSDWACPLIVTCTVFPVPVVVVTCGVVNELGPVVAMNWYAAAVPAAGVDPYAAAVLAPCSAAARARWLAWDHRANWIARRTAKKKAGMQTTNAASPSSPRIRRGPGSRGTLDAPAAGTGTELRPEIAARSCPAVRLIMDKGMTIRST